MKNIFILTADLLGEVLIILFRAKGKEDKKQTTFCVYADALP